MDGCSEGEVVVAMQFGHQVSLYLTSHPLQGAMKMAAVMADIIESATSDRLTLALEPEAACVACEQENSNLAKGDNFMVLDCGGGTIDITMHHVEEKNPVLKLKEIAPPSGGPFGSTYVDLEFEKFLQELIGDEAFARFKPSGEWVSMMRTWEGVKLGFDFKEEEDALGSSLINISPALEVRDLAS